MAMREELTASGTWLFRRRSYLPLAVLALVLLQIPRFTYLRGSRSLEIAWETACFLLTLTGFAIRVVTVGHAARGTSGRSTSAPSAAVLNQTGFYSVVRNPLYLGNCLIWMGLTLFLHSWWLTLIVVLVFALYHERIIFAEEEFLRAKFGATFLDWAAETPAFFPDFRRWKRAALPFSWQNAVRREYSGFLAIIATFGALEALSDWKVLGHFELNLFWLSLLLATAVFGIVVRGLARHTHVLDTSDR